MTKFKVGDQVRYVGGLDWIGMVTKVSFSGRSISVSWRSITRHYSESLSPEDLVLYENGLETMLRVSFD